MTTRLPLSSFQLDIIGLWQIVCRETRALEKKKRHMEHAMELIFIQKCKIMQPLHIHGKVAFGQGELTKSLPTESSWAAGNEMRSGRLMEYVVISYFWKNPKKRGISTKLQWKSRGTTMCGGTVCVLIFMHGLVALTCRHSVILISKRKAKSCDHIKPIPLPSWVSLKAAAICWSFHHYRLGSILSQA